MTDPSRPEHVVDGRANEAAIRHLASEISRLQVMLSQAIGNLALVNAKLEDKESQARK